MWGKTSRANCFSPSPKLAFSRPRPTDSATGRPAAFGRHAIDGMQAVLYIQRGHVLTIVVREVQRVGRVDIAVGEYARHDAGRVSAAREGRLLLKDVYAILHRRQVDVEMHIQGWREGGVQRWRMHRASIGAAQIHELAQQVRPSPWLIDAKHRPSRSAPRPDAHAPLKQSPPTSASLIFRSRRAQPLNHTQCAIESIQKSGVVVVAGGRIHGWLTRHFHTMARQRPLGIGLRCQRLRLRTRRWSR